MVDKRHTGTFHADAYAEVTSKMGTDADAAKITEAGHEYFEQSGGQLHKDVEVRGARRISHNVLDMEGSAYVLTHGIKLPVMEVLDGTGSVGKVNVKRALYGMGRLNGALTPLTRIYQPDLAFGIVQDSDDKHPAFQLSQFESTALMAEHIGRLAPDFHGFDFPEDYELALLYSVYGVETDLAEFYGLKGHLHMTLDAIGRGQILPAFARTHLGFDIQSSLFTKQVCQLALKKWHAFVVYVVPEESYRWNEKIMVTEWWQNNLGPGRVVVCPDTNYLPELWAGLAYVVETANPTEQGFLAFASTGGANRPVSRQELSTVWQWLQDARQHFGAQTRLPGYGNIPKPGDRFVHYRDPWPIGHSRFSENPSQSGSPTPPAPAPPRTIDWTRI